MTHVGAEEIGKPPPGVGRYGRVRWWIDAEDDVHGSRLDSLDRAGVLSEAPERDAEHIVIGPLPADEHGGRLAERGEGCGDRRVQLPCSLTGQ
jgi:hypothetical protein